MFSNSAPWQARPRSRPCRSSAGGRRLPSTGPPKCWASTGSRAQRTGGSRRRVLRGRPVPESNRRRCRLRFSAKRSVRIRLRLRAIEAASELARELAGADVSGSVRCLRRQSVVRCACRHSPRSKTCRSTFASALEDAATSRLGKVGTRGWGFGVGPDFGVSMAAVLAARSERGRLRSDGAGRGLLDSQADWPDPATLRARGSDVRPIRFDVLGGYGRDVVGLWPHQFASLGGRKPIPDRRVVALDFAVL